MPIGEGLQVLFSPEIGLSALEAKKIYAYKPAMSRTAVRVFGAEMPDRETRRGLSWRGHEDGRNDRQRYRPDDPYFSNGFPT
jgi:hypothetical protein